MSNHSEKIGFKEDCLAESIYVKIYVYYTEYLETIEMSGELRFWRTVRSTKAWILSSPHN